MKSKSTVIPPYEFGFVNAGGQRYKIEVSAMAAEII
jgi:hypothetical protein